MNRKLFRKSKRKLFLNKENEKLIEDTEAVRKEKKQLIQQEKMKDLKYSEQYPGMLDKEEKAKLNKQAEIKKIVDSQPTTLPSGNEK